MKISDLIAILKKYEYEYDDISVVARAYQSNELEQLHECDFFVDDFTEKTGTPSLVLFEY